MFFDLQNVFLGNPQLDPEYTDAFEIGYQRSGALGSLQVSPFFRYTSNIIRVDINTADTIANREVTTISFTNLDHSSSWGVDINGQLKLNPTIDEMKTSDLDLVVAGTADAVLMVESEAKELSEETMLEAVMTGHRGFQPVIEAIIRLAEKAAK